MSNRQVDESTTDLENPIFILIDNAKTKTPLPIGYCPRWCLGL